MSKKVITVLNVLASVLLLAAIFANLLAIYAGVNKGSFTPYDYIVTISLVVTAVFAIYYVLAGCKKGEGSTYFKWFMWVFAIVQLIALLQHESMTTVTVMLITLSFGCLTVLSTAKDLGQAKSTLLAGIISVCAIAQFITAAVAGTIGEAWIKITTLTLLALTSLLMVCAKYADKKSRGSK